MTVGCFEESHCYLVLLPSSTQSEIRKSVMNFLKRLTACMKENGEHFKHMLKYKPSVHIGAEDGHAEYLETISLIVYE